MENNADIQSVSFKQKLKIRFREILELLLLVGCGIPIALSIFESFFVLSPAVLLILGAFTFVALAHFLMVNTWSGNCKGSFCYQNNKLNEWFCIGRISILVFVPIGGLFTIALGLFQVLNPAVAIVFGVMSLAISFRVALKCWSWSKNDQNRENSNDARKYDSDLSERIWLKFMTITFPIACALLLLSALAGILSFATAGVCCIPFGGIGFFTGICFLWSKYHKSDERFFSNENHDISGQDNLDKSVQRATPIPQNQFNNMNLQQYSNDNVDPNNGLKPGPELPTFEEIKEAEENKLKDKGFNGDFVFSSEPGATLQKPKVYYNINEI